MIDPRLERYAARAYSLLTNYWFIADSHFDFLHARPGAVEIFGRAQLLDSSMLYITEVTEIRHGRLGKIDYSYQFRHEGEDGFFRYDNASHGRPGPNHHKHLGGKRIEQII